MPDSILDRIPVVGGLGYLERVRQLPARFRAVLQVEPGNRYFRQAIAVLVDGMKVGYVAPEVGGRYYEQVHEAGSVECPGRRARRSDHETSGVELLLDFTHMAQPSE